MSHAQILSFLCYLCLSDFFCSFHLFLHNWRSNDSQRHMHLHIVFSYVCAVRYRNADGEVLIHNSFKACDSLYDWYMRLCSVWWILAWSEYNLNTSDLKEQFTLKCKCCRFFRHLLLKSVSDGSHLINFWRKCLWFYSYDTHICVSVLIKHKKYITCICIVFLDACYPIKLHTSNKVWICVFRANDDWIAFTLTKAMWHHIFWTNVG